MNNVYTMDNAEVSNSPYNINHVKDLVLFAIIGIVVAFGLVVVIYLLDTTIKSEADVEEYAGLSVLSTIPVYQNKQNKNFNELIVNEEPKSPIAECFKTFRTNIMFSIQSKKLNTILVTSGFMSEGKSFVSSNLAVTFAQSGKKVILVDTDMRKGRVHKIFGLSNRPGLSNCLSSIGNDGDSVNINDYIQKSNIPNLHVMTSGDVPPNPSELLSSQNMKNFLQALNTRYDVVICDGTPCMLVSDSVILSKIVDTTVIVTANKVTKLDTLLKIKKSIEIVGGNIGGAVINKMTMSTKSYQNKYYYGNHNEITNELEFSKNICEEITNEPLYIENTVNIEPIIEEVTTENSTTPVNSNDNIDKLSNVICNNTKEILELKNMYKNVMQNTIDTLLKKEDNSNIIEELSKIKESYENSVKMQNEQIANLDNKLSNIKIEDNNDIILNELDNIKAQYEDAINTQNQYINALDNKLSNIKVEDNTDTILNELDNIKAHYEDAINTQNQYINALDNKLSNIKIEDNTDTILNELDNIKAHYEDAINTQNQYINALDNKLSNIKVEDNTDTILSELDNIKARYEETINMQNNKIDTLNNKVSNLNMNDNTELLDAMANIYKQLENINTRFDYLETKALHNEELIKGISSLNTSTYKNKTIDINNLNNKVIKIQDYLEDGYKNLSNENMLHSQRKNKNVLEGQINFIDNLLENTAKAENLSNENINTNIQENINNNKKDFIIDYEKVKNKERRKLFNFKKPNDEPEYEEEIHIVSQILSRKHKRASRIIELLNI